MSYLIRQMGQIQYANQNWTTSIMGVSANYPPVTNWQIAAGRGISQDDAEKSSMFCEQFGVTFPIAIDAPAYLASKSYVFSSVPTILLVDRERAIRFRLTGFSKAGLIRLSEEIAHLANRPPAPVFLPNELVPETKPG